MSAFPHRRYFYTNIIHNFEIDNNNRIINSCKIREEYQSHFIQQSNYFRQHIFVSAHIQSHKSSLIRLQFISGQIKFPIFVEILLQFHLQK